MTRPDLRRRPLPVGWVLVAAAAAAGCTFAVVFTVGITLSHDEQAGWGILLTLPVFAASFPVVAVFVGHALWRRDRQVRRRPLQVVAAVAAATTVASGALVAWQHWQEHRALDRGRDVAPARAYVDDVADAYRTAAAARGLSGWDHVPALEKWLLDLDGDGLVDADAAPVVALPDDGMIRIHDTDRDLVVDSIEVVDPPDGSRCIDVRWSERAGAFIEAFHEAREGRCAHDAGARVGR